MSIEVRVVPFASDTSLNCELAEVAKKFAVAAARLTTELLGDQTKPPARLEEYSQILENAVDKISASDLGDVSVCTGPAPSGPVARRLSWCDGKFVYYVWIDGKWVPSTGNPDGWKIAPAGVSYPVQCVSVEDANPNPVETGLYLQASEPLETYTCQYDLVPEGNLDEIVGFAVRFGRSRTEFLSIDLQDLDRRIAHSKGAGLRFGDSSGGRVELRDGKRVDYRWARSGYGDFRLRFFPTGPLSRSELRKDDGRVSMLIHFTGDPPVVGGVTWIGEDVSDDRLDPKAMPAQIGANLAASLQRFARTREVLAITKKRGPSITTRGFLPAE